MTTRHGGTSSAPFDTMNLRFGIGDHDAVVAENRRRLAAAVAVEAGRLVQPVYLDQVHGHRVVRLTQADARVANAPVADASVTTEHGVACAIQVADCLPVLFAAPGGVAAAHAGWRGLASGVLQATLAALCEAAACRPAEVSAWLGPCIGPRQFEVGNDVVRAFGAASAAAFEPCPSGHKQEQEGQKSATPKWRADLPRLAKERLQALGVGCLSGSPVCTVESPSRFFSYRRDGVTGRMVAVVWRR